MTGLFGSVKQSDIPANMRFGHGRPGAAMSLEPQIARHEPFLTQEGASSCPRLDVPGAEVSRPD